MTWFFQPLVSFSLSLFFLHVPFYFPFLHFRPFILFLAFISQLSRSFPRSRPIHGDDHSNSLPLFSEQRESERERIEHVDVMLERTKIFCPPFHVLRSSLSFSFIHFCDHRVMRKVSKREEERERGKDVKREVE